MWRRRRLACACLVLGITAVAAPRPLTAGVTPPVLEVQSRQLDNGLQVLLHEDHSVPVVNVQVWYHVGSKDERPGRTGFAHLFEHLMFKGSENVGPEEHAEFIQSIGGRHNAYTFFDQTVYWQTFPSNYLERILWMEADRMRSLDVSEENFVSERDVVKEERRLRVDNPPYGRLLEIVLENTFAEHPYRHLVIGSMDDLNAAALEDVRAFHRRFYVPNNATLVISGDLDPEQTLAWVKKYFGSIPKGQPIDRNLTQEPPQEDEHRVVVYDSKAPLPAVVFTYHVPQDGHPDIYALNVASKILSDGESSRLYRKLVYDEQIALQAAGQALPLEDPGVFFFFAIMNQGHSGEEGQEALDEEIQRLKEGRVSAEELAKAKNQFVADLVFGRQTVQEKADAIGHAAVILDDVGIVNRQLAAYQAVTAADVQQAAQKYFTPSNRTVVYMLPESMRPAEDDGAEATQEGSR